MEYSENRIRPLIIQLEKMVQTVTADAQIETADLRRVLRFITKVTQVVNQAFSNVYPLLIEISFLREKDLQTDKIDTLRKELSLLNARDYYRDMELICGQLKELSRHYHQSIQPIIQTLSADTRQEFSQVFALLEEHEGYILLMVQDITGGLTWSLQNLHTTTDLGRVRVEAAQQAHLLQAAIDELTVINSRILGLSGSGDGYLELTETDRLSLQQKVLYELNYIDQSRHLDRSIRTGNIHLTGGTIAFGDHSHQQVTFAQQATPPELLAAIDHLIREVPAENLPPGAAEKALRHLQNAREEMSEKEPDKKAIGKSMEKVAATLEGAGKIIDATSSMGQKILAIAKWVGIAITAVV